jgi:hypothetical protein
MITSNKPIVQSGITYDNFAVTLASSPLWKEGEVGATVAMRLSYYTKDSNGLVIRPENVEDVPVVYMDVLSSNDPAALTAFNKIVEAIQGYINAKGL